MLGDPTESLSENICRFFFIACLCGLDCYVVILTTVKMG